MNRGGNANAERLRTLMKTVLASEPLAQMQYVSCADYDTLQELEQVSGKNPCFRWRGVYRGRTRLDNNFVLG